MPFFLFMLLSGLSLLSATGLLSRVFGIPTRETLTIRTTRSKSEIRLDYVNADGKICLAADRGYATQIRTQDTEGRNILQAYYDENGEPAVLSGGYHAIRREYNSEGQNDRITYLGTEMQPMTVTGGYVTIIRSYNAEGKAETDTYRDADGNPVSRTGGYYGYRRTYDSEGRIASVTYLDAEGNPVNNRYGYATEERTYDEEGKLLQRRYFGVDGEPTAAGRMQYGVQYEDGNAVYLDEDGNTTARLDNYLLTNPLTVILSAVILLLLCLAVRGRGRTALLILYIGFIGYMTLANRNTAGGTVSLIPFASYRRFFTSRSIRQQILNNIWLFIPLGFLLGKGRGGKRTWLIPIALSVAIEFLQYVLKIGHCETDDVISNGIGGLIGMGLAMPWLKARRTDENSNFLLNRN